MRRCCEMIGQVCASAAVVLLFSMLLVACAGSGGTKAAVPSEVPKLELTVVQWEALGYLEHGPSPDALPPELDGRFEVIVGIRNTTDTGVVLDGRLLYSHHLLLCFNSDGDYVRFGTSEPWAFNPEVPTVHLAAGETMWLRRDIGAHVWIPHITEDAPIFVKAQYGPGLPDTPDDLLPLASEEASSKLEKIIVPR